MEKRLLVVDDTPAMGEFVNQIASEIGFKVQVEVHGLDFMSVYDTFNPDVVMIDIVMPDVDGIELVHWLRDRGSRPKIIVASAFNPTSAKQSADLGKIEGLDIVAVEKPFVIDELVGALGPAQ